MLLDIEGTTTSIAFVYDVLFPFARQRLAATLEATWDDPATIADVVALRELAESDEATPGLPDPGAPVAEQRAAVLALLLALMDADRKVTPLKAIQGRIWRAGYEDGSIAGHVFDDVPEALRRWHSKSRPVHIYSSGSVAAQRLLFRYSCAGDLTPLLAGYFDTTSGPKTEADSYLGIARALEAPPGTICFVSDNPRELDAAALAGLEVFLAVRPGNPTVDRPNLRSVSSLLDLA